MKRNKCEICDHYSDKRKICIDCKQRDPYIASAKGEYPFSRK